MFLRTLHMHLLDYLFIHLFLTSFLLLDCLIFLYILRTLMLCLLRKLQMPSFFQFDFPDGCVWGFFLFFVSLFFWGFFWVKQFLMYSDKLHFQIRQTLLPCYKEIQLCKLLGHIWLTCNTQHTHTHRITVHEEISHCE